MECIANKNKPNPVRALALQGGEVTLAYALLLTKAVNHLIVSPLFCGSNPYLCSSLTYRVIYYLNSIMVIYT